MKVFRTSFYVPASVERNWYIRFGRDVDAQRPWTSRRVGKLTPFRAFFGLVSLKLLSILPHTLFVSLYPTKLTPPPLGAMGSASPFSFKYIYSFPEDTYPLNPRPSPGVRPARGSDREHHQRRRYQPQRRRPFAFLYVFALTWGYKDNEKYRYSTVG